MSCFVALIFSLLVDYFVKKEKRPPGSFCAALAGAIARY